MTDVKDPALYPFFVRIDGSGNFSVIKEVTPEEGKPYIKYLGHYFSFADSLLAILNLIKKLPQPNKVQYNSVREYIDAYKDYQEKYIEEINKFKQTLGI